MSSPAIAIDETNQGQHPHGAPALVGGLERDDLRDLRAKRLGVHDSDLRRAVVVATAESAARLAFSVRLLNAALLGAVLRRAQVSSVDLGVALDMSAERVRRMADPRGTAALHYGAVVVLCARLPLVVDVVAAVVAAQAPGLAAAIARHVAGDSK